MDNNYYNYETPYYDTPNTPNIDKYKNITNVSQLRNYYIKQPNSNEFIIKCNKEIFGLIVFLLVASGFLTLFICILVYDFGEYSYGGIIFGICFAGFLATVGLFGLLAYKVRQKVILTEDYIQIKNYYILCCLNSNKKYNYTNIKNFEVEIKKEYDEGREATSGPRIICWNNSNKKEYFFDHIFELEEAEYFVYVVNNLINKKKNLGTLN